MSDGLTLPGPWTGSWDDDDPDAAFKQEVADYTRADPLATLRGLAARTGVPVGVLARYALVKWAAEGSETLLALGPATLRRLAATVEDAERVGTDTARLAAYHRLRGQLSWLRAALDDEPAERHPSPRQARGHP